METTIFDKDFKVFYITAKSYPEGILEAHQKLHSLVPFTIERKYFGISRPENGTIIYRAAAEEIKPGEAEKYNCKTLILKKGRYVSTTIKNYLKDIQAIDRTFKKLLLEPGLDHQGYCVEWYFNETDVKCMIRLNDG